MRLNINLQLPKKETFIFFFSQGVTLTDLQEAEKTIGRSRTPKTREEERDEKEKQDKEKQEEKKETEINLDDYRSKYRSIEEVCLSYFTSTSQYLYASVIVHFFTSSFSPSSVTGLYLPPPPRLFPQSALPPPLPTLAAHCPPVPAPSTGPTVCRGSPPPIAVPPEIQKRVSISLVYSHTTSILTTTSTSNCANTAVVFTGPCSHGQSAIC